MPVDITGRICLGRVRDHRDRPTFRIATIDPIAISNAELTAWGITGLRVGEHFPDRGLVLWFMPPVSIKDGTVWEFEVESHPNTGREEGRGEKFQVNNKKGPKEIIEIMDLRSADGEKAIRDGLLGDGFQFPLRPVSSRVYLLIEEGELLGPFEVEQVPSNTSLYKLSGITSDKLNRIEIWEAPVTLREVEFIGNKRLPMPPGHRQLVKYPDAVKNWEPDLLLLTRTLKWLGDHDPETMAALGLNTKNTIKAFADNLKKLHLIGEELQVALARKERLWELDGLVERNAEVLEAAASVLFGNERVQKELHEKVTADTDRLKREEERKIAEELKEKKADLDETEGKIREQKGRLKKLEKDCRTAEAQLEKKTGPYTAELAKKLEEVAKEPHKAFSELAFLRSIFGGMAVADQPTSGQDVTSLLPQGKMLHSNSVDANRIDEAGKFVSRLGRRMLSRRINDVSAAPLTAAFLSGRIPMLDGPFAYPMLESFAETISGVKPLWIPIGGSLYEVQDLFGRQDASGKFVIHPGGLFPFLVEARKRPESMFVVVLDGFNKSPSDSYLFPIIQCIRDSGREIPIHAVLRMDGGSATGFLFSIDWPTNVLLALIPSSGGMRIPISADLSREVVPLVPPEDHIVDDEPGPFPAPSVVISDVWNKWRQDALEAEKTFEKDEGRFGKGAAEFMTPLHGAATVVGMDPRKALIMEIVSGAVPEILRRGEKPESVLAESSVDASTSIKAMQNLMARLGG
jgi:hypothetical protein